MVLTALAHQASGPGQFHSFLEHPRDPIECSRAPAANKCSSIWATEVYDQWAKTVRHNKIHLDSRPMQAGPSGPEEHYSLDGPSPASLARAWVQPWQPYQAQRDEVRWLEPPPPTADEGVGRGHHTDPAEGKTFPAGTTRGRRATGSDWSSRISPPFPSEDLGGWPHHCSVGLRPDHCEMVEANLLQAEDLRPFGHNPGSQNLVKPVGRWHRPVHKTSKPPSTNYFTSCDPHHDISTFCYWQIFWHSSWHIFWHSIWQTFWHFIWHIFWHSIWHFIWHSIWHTFWILLAFYLAYLLTFYLAYLLALSGISSNILSGISSGTLSGISSGISIWPLRSSGAHWAGKVPGWGPAVHTELGRSQVEVQRCTLSWAGPWLRSSGAHWAGQLPGWGPAVHTELGRSQGEGEVQRCTLSWEVGKELGEESWQRAWPRIGKAEVQVEVDADMVEEKLEEEDEEEDEDEEEVNSDKI